MRPPHPALELSFPAESGLGDLISAELYDLAPAAVHETDGTGGAVWRVFFASTEARVVAHAALERRFAGAPLAIAAVDVPDEDWAARSQAALRHVRVGRIVVAPPWDVPEPLAPEDRLVRIRPSMGFGTGHHATTRLCLQLLQQVDCAGRTVLDVGTGSGVLALAAESLGAVDVLGIDVDLDALASAEENRGLTPGAHVRFAHADLRDLNHAADVVLANLTGAALMNAAPQLLSSVRSGGWIVLSGFQEPEADAVIAAFSGAAVCQMREAEEGWVATLLKR